MTPYELERWLDARDEYASEPPEVEPDTPPITAYGAVIDEGEDRPF
jgi:hypothetical protein